jgi:hypothetical protein
MLDTESVTSEESVGIIWRYDYCSQLENQRPGVGVCIEIRSVLAKFLWVIPLNCCDFEGATRRSQVFHIHGMNCEQTFWAGLLGILQPAVHRHASLQIWRDLNCDRVD